MTSTTRVPPGDRADLTFGDEDGEPDPPDLRGRGPLRVAIEVFVATQNADRSANAKVWCYNGRKPAVETTTSYSHEGCRAGRRAAPGEATAGSFENCSRAPTSGWRRTSGVCETRLLSDADAKLHRRKRARIRSTCSESLTSYHHVMIMSKAKYMFVREGKNLPQTLRTPGYCVVSVDLVAWTWSNCHGRGFPKQ